MRAWVYACSTTGRHRHGHAPTDPPACHSSRSRSSRRAQVPVAPPPPSPRSCAAPRPTSAEDSPAGAPEPPPRASAPPGGCGPTWPAATSPWPSPCCRAPARPHLHRVRRARRRPPRATRRTGPVLESPDAAPDGPAVSATGGTATEPPHYGQVVKILGQEQGVARAKQVVVEVACGTVLVERTNHGGPGGSPCNRLRRSIVTNRAAHSGTTRPSTGTAEETGRTRGRPREGFTLWWPPSRQEAPRSALTTAVAAGAVASSCTRPGTPATRPTATAARTSPATSRRVRAVRRSS
ncbi:hypothetical protein STENM36S_05863 [Streptomyces tendae]